MLFNQGLLKRVNYDYWQINELKEKERQRRKDAEFFIIPILIDTLPLRYLFILIKN